MALNYNFFDKGPAWDGEKKVLLLILSSTKGINLAAQLVLSATLAVIR